MRRLAQPGPAAADRIEWFPGQCERLKITLTPGATLAEAIARPLVAAGLHAAVLEIRGLVLAPLRCVMPGPPDGPLHVAYFSAPREVRRALIEQANVTFGSVDGTTRRNCSPGYHAVSVWCDMGARVV
ncbi:MAG TPA: hypothetical protein VMB34_20465 [Acetobacteraceae bacterium]|nr:hypothetical protein [Acetobacteraceae bacterium]